jgi:hypothetical protein
MSEATFSENAEADLLVLENELRPFSNLGGVMPRGPRPSWP